MAFRQRTPTFRPTFRPQLSVRRSEWKETPEAYLLHVYIPGFTKDRIKITLEDSSKMVRIAGEQPLQGNRWVRFDQTYPVPENSEAETIEANFEQSTLILKIQKKTIPQQLAPKEEVEPKSPKHPSDDKPLDEEPKHEKVQETIPAQRTTTPKIEENEEKESAQKEETLSQIPQETITNYVPQKGKVEFETKPPSLDEEPKQEKVQETIPPQPTTTPKIEENEEKGSAQKEETLSQIPQETITNYVPQKGKEEFETKPTSLETTKTRINENPQKGQEEVEPKPTLTTSTKEELKEKIVEKSVEDDIEKERISKKEAKEEHEKPSEIEKGKEAEEPLAPKVEEKEKESCCKTSLNKEEKSSGKDIVEDNGIRKLASSSSNFVTRMAEGKWSYEQRYLLENIGAAVLIIAALGAYVSYRFAS